MQTYQGFVVCWLTLLPYVLGFPSEADITTPAESSLTTLSPTSNSNEAESTTESSLTTLPPLPDITTAVPPVVSNGTVVNGNNSTTTVGNSTVTVIGNNTIIVSQPGNEITVNILPGGGIAVNVSRPGKNISVTPDGTIITNGGSHKPNFFKISESISLGNPNEFRVPTLNLPQFSQLQHRRRNRFPFDLIGIRNFEPESNSGLFPNPNIGLGGLEFPINLDGQLDRD